MQLAMKEYVWWYDVLSSKMPLRTSEMSIRPFWLCKELPMKRLSLCLISILALNPLYAGDATAYINKALSKMEKPFTLKMAMESSIPNMQTEVKVSGSVAYKDENHSNIDVKLAISSAQTPMEMGFKIVDDGTFLWVLTSMPAMGMNQVIKTKSGNSDSLAQMPGMEQVKNLNPVNLSKLAKEKLQFKVADRSGGKVTLEAEITDDFSNQTGMNNFGISGGKVQWILDEKKSFPMELKLVSEQASFTAILSDYAPLKDDSPFSFTPPEGASVMDMTQAAK